MHELSIFMELGCNFENFLPHILKTQNKYLSAFHNKITERR